MYAVSDAVLSAPSQHSTLFYAIIAVVGLVVVIAIVVTLVVLVVRDTGGRRPIR